MAMLTLARPAHRRFGVRRIQIESPQTVSTVVGVIIEEGLPVWAMGGVASEHDGRGRLRKARMRVAELVNAQSVSFLGVPP